MAGKVSARVAGAAGDPAPWASTSASSVGILMTSAAQTAREAPLQKKAADSSGGSADGSPRTWSASTEPWREVWNAKLESQQLSPEPPPRGREAGGGTAADATPSPGTRRRRTAPAAAPPAAAPAHARPRPSSATTSSRRDTVTMAAMRSAPGGRKMWRSADDADQRRAAPSIVMSARGGVSTRGSVAWSDLESVKSSRMGTSFDLMAQRREPMRVRALSVQQRAAAVREIEEEKAHEKKVQRKKDKQIKKLAADKQIREEKAQRERKLAQASRKEAMRKETKEITAQVAEREAERRAEAEEKKEGEREAELVRESELYSVTLASWKAISPAQRHLVRGLFKKEGVSMQWRQNRLMMAGVQLQLNPSRAAPKKKKQQQQQSNREDPLSAFMARNNAAGATESKKNWNLERVRVPVGDGRKKS